MEYKSEIFEVLHQSAAAKYKIGAISAARMREYDKACLVPEAAQEDEKSPQMERPKAAAAGI